MCKNVWRHGTVGTPGGEIPFCESEIDCVARETPGCVADISVGVADSFQS